MKNYLIIALLLGAIPAVAVGQTVSCDGCTHVLPVYYGEGGFIAEVDADTEEVTYVATCNGVTRSDEIEAEDGMVSMLLMGDLACMDDDEDNSFEVGPVMDGGWYWITLETNSAVGGLVSKMVLDNETVDVADAGDGVKMMEGRGAVLLTETATGRTGLLPNILPEPPMPDATLCGAIDRGRTRTPQYIRRTSNCALGDGKTITLATRFDSNTGGSARIADGGRVPRPGAGGSFVVTVDLWGNGTGHFVTTYEAGGTPTGVSALRGQPAVAMTALRGATRLTGATYTVNLGMGASAASVTDQDVTGSGGVTWSSATATDAATITIGPDSAYCSNTNNESLAVRVDGFLTEANRQLITPEVARQTTTDDRVGRTSFTIVCPSSAAANMGTDLVPENPFPTDR